MLKLFFSKKMANEMRFNYLDEEGQAGTLPIYRTTKGKEVAVTAVAKVGTSHACCWDDMTEVGEATDYDSFVRKEPAYLHCQ